MVTIRQLAAPPANARVLRPTRLFRDASEALRHGCEEGLRFVRASPAPIVSV